VYVRTSEGLAQAQGCDDADISRVFGVPRGTHRDELLGFDSAFAGPTGGHFRDMIVRAANEFRIHPALLAVSALAETGGRGNWLRSGGIDNVLIGLDFWDQQRNTIRNQLRKTFPARLITDPRSPDCTIVGGECHFVNERGRDTGRMHMFPSGQDGLRAMAAWSSILERRLIDATGGLSRWIVIPISLQWALTRLSYNPGRNNPRKLARRTLADVDAGRDPLRNFPRTGPGGSHHPVRASVIRAAQALHLANIVFGSNVPCLT
jgi:hypothetical protein